MMRVPGWLLLETVTITPQTGMGWDGPEYGTPYTARCHIEPGQRKVTDRQGEEVVAEATAFFVPEVAVKPGDKVTWEGRTYTVIEARPWRALGRPSHVEVALK